MKQRQFGSGRTAVWRNRFVQIAREMDASTSGTRPPAALLGLRLRRSAHAIARIRGRAAGLASA